MRGTRRLSLTVWAAFILTAMVLVSGASRAEAATRTWKNVGTNWSVPGNWVENVTPVDGDDLVFPIAGMTASRTERKRTARSSPVTSTVVCGSLVFYFVSTVENEAIVVTRSGFQNEGALEQDGLSTILTGPVRLVGGVKMGGTQGDIIFKGPVSGTGRLIAGTITTTLASSAEYLLGRRGLRPQRHTRHRCRRGAPRRAADRPDPVGRVLRGTAQPPADHQQAERPRAARDGQPSTTIRLTDNGEATFTGRIDGAGAIQKLGPFELRFEKGVSYYREPSAVAAWETFSKGYGPTRMLAASLDPERLATLREEFIAFHASYQTELGICVPREYWVTLGVRV